MLAQVLQLQMLALQVRDHATANMLLLAGTHAGMQAAVRAWVECHS
jgi:hypothetical protein